MRREEREKEREQRREKDKERQKARLKEREARRNERLKEREKEESKVERRKEEQTKWKPVSKEIDWKKENLEKKQEIHRRVGAPSIERPSRADARSRNEIRRRGKSDSSSGEETSKPRIPSLMSIVTTDAKRGSRSRDGTPVERTKDNVKKSTELESRKRKMLNTEQEKEDDAKRKPRALDKVEQKLKERKQQKQLPPPPPIHSAKREENPESLSGLKKIEQRLKERREKNRSDLGSKAFEGRKDDVEDEVLQTRKHSQGKSMLWKNNNFFLMFRIRKINFKVKV